MATENDDIIIDNTGEDMVADGDDMVDDGTLSDCFIIFKLNKGEMKNDPLLGPDLVKLTNAHNGSGKMKQELQLALEMDGKEAKSLKVVDGNIDFEI